MKIYKLFVVLSALALVLTAVGCGSPAQGSPVPGSNNGSGNGAAGPVDPATAATIKGKVEFKGTAPKPVPILMDAESTCVAKHPDGVFTEEVVVNPNNTLKNVFVYVKDGLGDLKFPISKDPVVLDQNGCVYNPHVFGIQVGQDLIIRNSDGILHNIHPQPKINRPFNVGQPKDMDSKKTFEKAELYVSIECDVHDWMHAYVNIMDNPYYSTTGDDGTFSLPNLPPGTYTIVAWQETYGEQTMSVTVAAKDTKEISFTFEGK